MLTWVVVLKTGVDSAGRAVVRVYERDIPDHVEFVDPKQDVALRLSEETFSVQFSRFDGEDLSVSQLGAFPGKWGDTERAQAYIDKLSKHSVFLLAGIKGDPNDSDVEADPRNRILARGFSPMGQDEYPRIDVDLFDDAHSLLNLVSNTPISRLHTRLSMQDAERLCFEADEERARAEPDEALVWISPAGGDRYGVIVAHRGPYFFGMNPEVGPGIDELGINRSRTLPDAGGVYFFSGRAWGTAGDDHNDPDFGIDGEFMPLTDDIAARFGLTAAAARELARENDEELQADIDAGLVATPAL